MSKSNQERTWGLTFVLTLAARRRNKISTRMMSFMLRIEKGMLWR
jgi:hypothetical protein